MKSARLVLLGGMYAAAMLAVAPSAQAQQIETTGTPGSPDATTTISGKQLPPPAPKFGGVIKDDALSSTRWWPPRVVPPKGVPNVLLIMTDDAAKSRSRSRISQPTDANPDPVTKPTVIKAKP